MNSGAFIGGVLAGALGLAAAALIDKRIGEGKFSPKLKNPEKLDEEGLIRELNSFFFKAQAIYARCNEAVLAASELIVTPVELPWDNPAQKFMNSMGGKMTQWRRNGLTKELMGLGREMAQLYARYQGVFERANSLLVERGFQAAPISRDPCPESLIRPDTSLNNDDWDVEFGEMADSIVNFIERSCAMAEELIDRLERIPADSATEILALRQKT